MTVIEIQLCIQEINFTNATVEEIGFYCYMQDICPFCENPNLRTFFAILL